MNIKLPFRNRSNRIYFDLPQLEHLTFGRLEGEKDDKLNIDTFFPTESIKQLLKDPYNYILAPKGVGKSAIFSALEKKYISKELFDYNDHTIVAINNAFGSDSDYLNPQRFSDDSRSKNAIFWGLYIMSELIKDIIVNHSSKSNYSAFRNKIRSFEGVKDKFKLYNVADVLNQLKIGFAFNVSGQIIEVAPTINLNRVPEKIILNDVFKYINDFYKENDLTSLIIIDRVDNFVGKESAIVQKNYLQGLIDCIEEITYYSNLDPALFLRTDLFYSFDLKLEYDKIKDRKIDLKWEESETLNFIFWRLLSNKYISNNYSDLLIKIFNNEFGESKKKWLSYLKDLLNKLNVFKPIIRIFRSSSTTKNKNIPYKLSETFIYVFFPSNLSKFNNQDFCEWLLEKFKDSNGYINPRLLIYFFNKLMYNQHKYNRLNYSSIMSQKIELKINEKWHFDIFDQEVIIETYNHCKNDELRNIYKLLKSKEHQTLFLEINSKCLSARKFKIGDFNLKRLGIDGEQFNELVKYLLLLGFCREIEKHIFEVSELYQYKLELGNLEN